MLEFFRENGKISSQKNGFEVGQTFWITGLLKKGSSQVFCWLVKRFDLGVTFSEVSSAPPAAKKQQVPAFRQCDLIEASRLINGDNAWEKNE